MTNSLAGHHGRVTAGIERAFHPGPISTSAASLHTRVRSRVSETKRDRLRGVTSSHYFDDDPSVASDVHRIPLHLADMSIELDVDRGVFSSTKIDAGTRVLLVEAALPGDAETILDIGCGYGPIACAVAKRAPKATVWAVDVNARARGLCAANADRLGLNISVHEPDAVPADQTFDLIVSNPPYIAADEIAALAPEVRLFEPMALTDEGDGLSAYRAITAGAPEHLRAGGHLMVEIGWTQGKAVAGMFRANGFDGVEILPDLDGRDRVVQGIWRH